MKLAVRIGRESKGCAGVGVPAATVIVVVVVVVVVAAVIVSVVVVVVNVVHVVVDVVFFCFPGRCDAVLNSLLRLR